MDLQEITHDRYYTYAELTAALEALAVAFPELARLSSIGTTFRGREIWLVEITNPATGAAETKPGYYIDAHIHAEEHVTSSVALYAIWYLLTRYGDDPQVTRLVDRQVFYVLPRLNPDGAEISLTPPYHRWVGNGRYAPGQERDSGLIPEDLDGDGFVAHMRVRDPDGEWKRSERDPRLLIPRAPDEHGGEYYRLYPEGRLRFHEGPEVVIEKPRDGNLNRNFPIGWKPESEQYGAGELPLSEPETAALVRFVLDHPNIAGMCTYHSHGGVMLRPSMTRPDDEMPPGDLATYRDLGAIATAVTGYPTVSVFEDFTPDKSRPRRGGFEDLTYETLGIITFGPEVWDIERAAGVSKDRHYSLHPRGEDALHKVFAWVMEHCPERGFREWTPFDHPDLGPVEIGGLIDIWTYRNPPPRMLEGICRKNVLFNLKHAAAAPRVRLKSVTATDLGGDLYKVEALVANEGYLPTNLSEAAVQNGAAEPVWVELLLAGAELVMNPARVSVGHLAGWSERQAPWSPFGRQWTASRATVAWLVRAVTVDPEIVVTARSQRAGVDERRIDLAIATGAS